ncbi:hypothetical protein [Streptomyces sp. ID05-47C]|uniref:hypothetical protein n=1 Tax=Streptomyces sp. ID05-47C TaxID=3028665 RepID=UPI0029A3627C|nr:hypothetical protein [Streptomyces sp. ID05-47C]MDX3571140.1 hypothetical protein [Streptomyces sp. ID05-47C]
MRNGGEAREADADGNDTADRNDTADGHGEPRQETGQSADPAPPTLLRRLKKHRLLASAVTLALVATGVAVPLALAGQDDGPPCQEIPAATRALAENPAAATRALDPGDDLNRLDAVRRLLAHEHPCSDGGQALGAVVDAATRATGPDTPHTLAQARAAFGVVAALNDVSEIPDGMAPGVARMLAEYVVDQHLRVFGGEIGGADRPAVPAESARPDGEGWTRYGRFLAPAEPHVDFSHGRAAADPENLVPELAKDPQAFAILYAAERAWFAYYLERLDGQGSDSGYHPKPSKSSDGYDAPQTYWVDHDIENMTDRIGVLMAYRSLYARDGTIPDLTAYDAAVRRYTPGVYLAQERQLHSRPPMTSIAARKPSGRADRNLMDARHQLNNVLDAWAAARRISVARASALRQVIDNRYVRVLWMTR